MKEWMITMECLLNAEWRSLISGLVQNEMEHSVNNEVICTIARSKISTKPSGRGSTEHLGWPGQMTSMQDRCGKTTCTRETGKCLA